MDIFMSFDTKSMSKRIEENKVDPYCIDLEDYENINDLIDRSIRTKTKFVPEHVQGAVYDSDEDIKSQLEQEQYIDRIPASDTSDAPDATDAERSEAKEASSSAEDTDETELPLG